MMATSQKSKFPAAADDTPTGVDGDGYPHTPTHPPGCGESVAGRYRLQKLIGHGGMADIYRGRDTLTGRLVAIKTPRRQCCDQPGVWARFHHEQHALARLDHPSIVHLLDCGHTCGGGRGPNQPYMILEFLDGTPIRQLLTPHTPLTIRDACMIAADILAGLWHAHQRGITHGDLSAANVMVCAAGNAKIIDFGAGRSAEDPDQTMPGPILRTPRYMAPEQAVGQPPNPSTDIYGSGCLLYLLLTGQPPFPGDDPVALAYQHVHQPPSPPSTHRPGIPQQIDRIVLRALAKHTADRYPDINQFRRNLLAAAPAATRPSVRRARLVA